ncbi:MAG: PHP-associated domain-containing protein [archaeon]
MITCDVHVHSTGSNRIIPANSATKKYNIQESYVNAEHQYQLTKSRGRELVTLSDHNSISEAKKLVELHPEDCFMSCEYEVKGEPGGQDPEILVLGLTEEFHEELMHVRKYGIKDFIGLVKQEKRPHALAHPGYPVNPKGPRLTVKEIEYWTDLCDVIEGINGDGMRENELAQIVAKQKGKPMSGGSDDHAGLFTGLTYTVAPDADYKEEFLQHFREGKIYPEGESGSMQKSYQVMLTIGKQFIASERNRRSEVGYINYFRKNPLRFVELMFIPYILPLFLNVSSRKYRNSLEKRTLALEDKYFEHLKTNYKLELKEKVRGLKKKQDEELADLLSMVKDKSDYITKHTFFERVINWVLKNNRSVQNDFDSV